MRSILREIEMKLEGLSVDKETYAKIEEIELIDVSWGEFDGINRHVTEKTSCLVDSSNKCRADHRLTVRIDPAVLFDDSE